MRFIRNSRMFVALSRSQLAVFVKIHLRIDISKEVEDIPSEVPPE
jgi:hypothetical protein